VGNDNKAGYGSDN